MRWIADQSGRFGQRPHYDPGELDRECEDIVHQFLRRRHTRVEFPVATDDLTAMIEEVVEDLDMYADLSGEGTDVEGVTDFIHGRSPRIRISKDLSERRELENRLRTTLTHEFGHARFHNLMYQLQQGDLLFPGAGGELRARCKRAGIIGTSQRDWMEWQAGYICGAVLMPRTALHDLVKQHRAGKGFGVAVLEASSAAGEALILAVADQFAVSREAARVRLIKQNLLIEEAKIGTGFFG